MLGVEADAEVLVDGASGKEAEVGTVRAVLGDVGLAHLRLGAAAAAMHGRLRLLAAGVPVMPHRPGWWPEAWVAEQDEQEMELL